MLFREKFVYYIIIFIQTGPFFPFFGLLKTVKIPVNRSSVNTKFPGYLAFKRERVLEGRCPFNCIFKKERGKGMLERKMRKCQ
jgi:hypothetical protein